MGVKKKGTTGKQNGKKKRQRKGKEKNSEKRNREKKWGKKEKRKPEEKIASNREREITKRGKDKQKGARMEKWNKEGYRKRPKCITKKYRKIISGYAFPRTPLRDSSGVHRRAPLSWQVRALGDPETYAPRSRIQGNFLLGSHERLAQQRLPRAQPVAVEIFHHRALQKKFSILSSTKKKKKSSSSLLRGYKNDQIFRGGHVRFAGEENNRTDILHSKITTNIILWLLFGDLAQILALFDQRDRRRGRNKERKQVKRGEKEKEPKEKQVKKTKQKEQWRKK